MFCGQSPKLKCYVNGAQNLNVLLAEPKPMPISTLTLIFFSVGIDKLTITDRTLDVVFFRFRDFSFTITLMRELSFSLVIQRYLRGTACGFCLRDMVSYLMLLLIYHRFVYGWIGIDNQRQGLVKKDLEDSRNDKVWSVPFHYPGEPFFVANTGK